MGFPKLDEAQHPQTMRAVEWIEGFSLLAETARIEIKLWRDTPKANLNREPWETAAGDALRAICEKVVAAHGDTEPAMPLTPMGLRHGVNWTRLVDILWRRMAQAPDPE